MHGNKSARKKSKINKFDTMKEVDKVTKQIKTDILCFKTAA